MASASTTAPANARRSPSTEGPSRATIAAMSTKTAIGASCMTQRMRIIARSLSRSNAVTTWRRLSSGKTVAAAANKHTATMSGSSSPCAAAPNGFCGMSATSCCDTLGIAAGGDSAAFAASRGTV